MSRLIEFVPIITTLFSIYFFSEIYSHYLIRKTKYLLWWSVGVLTFGMGTSAESINAIFGWNEINLKYWYIVGALLGGFPLAQGTVYLLMKKRFADITSLILLIIIAIASVFVILTPFNIPADFRYKLTGSVFAWQWVRYFSPFVNLYASVFLIGGAVYSAIRYYKQTEKEARFIGNIYIALGGLLPGIGGSFTRMGYVNVLFITELTGLLLIYYGYRIIKLDKRRYKSNTQGSV